MKTNPALNSAKCWRANHVHWLSPLLKLKRFFLIHEFRDCELLPAHQFKWKPLRIVHYQVSFRFTNVCLLFSVSRNSATIYADCATLAQTDPRMPQEPAVADTLCVVCGTLVHKGELLHIIEGAAYCAEHASARGSAEFAAPYRRLLSTESFRRKPVSSGKTCEALGAAPYSDEKNKVSVDRSTWKGKLLHRQPDIKNLKVLNLSHLLSCISSLQLVFSLRISRISQFSSYQSRSRCGCAHLRRVLNAVCLPLKGTR